MALIKSISGIRGTVGGAVGEGLTPIDTVKFAAAYGSWLKDSLPGKTNYKVVVGRDARPSGPVIHQLVCATLQGLGIDVLDLGLSTTPTVEIAVTAEKADGGIILTASHNPVQWNALKLLNYRGEFVSAADGEEILKIADNEQYVFAAVDKLGGYDKSDVYIQKHIDSILQLDLVDVAAVRQKKFKIVVDAVNSTGGIAVPALLEQMGVEVVKLYCEPNGNFPHNPEPLKEHLTDISRRVVEEHADLGIVVDPDVDRLAIVNEDGSMFGEEYTLVAVADYVLSQTKGNTVSNLSSSRALRDISRSYDVSYNAGAVGEVNVVEVMKKTDAIIGGEGNGGVIYPKLHYGRDALVGIALFLTHLAKTGKSCKTLRETYPAYYMSKNKIQLSPGMELNSVLKTMEEKYASEDCTTVDGLKIDFSDQWVHLRKSNTEPIIRIYTEGRSQQVADALAQKIMNEIAAIATV